MPIVDVHISQAARDDYLSRFKAQAVSRMDAHMTALWARFATDRPWEEMVFSHRAMQAYAYLNDPDRSANIARYPAIPAGVGYYGTTEQEVAVDYISYFTSRAESMRGIFESYRMTVEQIPGKSDTIQVTGVVDSFIAANPLP